MHCSCEPKNLLNFGCTCGAFKFEISDHVWFNGVIYAVARNGEEATALCREFLSEFTDFDPEWLIGSGWEIIPDDWELPLLIEDDANSPELAIDLEETRLASEWAAAYGPGFLAVV